MTETLPIRATGAFRPRVAVSCPTYDNRVHKETVRALMNPTRHDGTSRVDVVSFIDTNVSLLAHTFNNAIVAALEARDGWAGTAEIPSQARPTHFAMIHADIGPRVAGWVDALWDVMDATGAEVVSTVVPIKEPTRERTSTAIGRRDDPWKLDRYITAADLGVTPPTFTAADVCGEGEVLLINTGLWLADLRCPWWDEFPGFEIRDRIARGEDGRRVSQVRPEDWEFSRFLDRVGAKYAATWEVPVSHSGDAAWFNFGGGG